jgi:hypothetical protein
VGHFQTLPLGLLCAVIRFSYHIGCCVTLKIDRGGKPQTFEERICCALFDNASVRYLFSFAHGYYLVFLMESHHTEKEAATSRSGVMTLQENLQFNISAYRNFSWLLTTL